jgi:ABC-type transport system substrate-binding protein
MTVARDAVRGPAAGWRRMVRGACVAMAAFAWVVGGSAAADPAKVLRIASPDIDTLDPQNYTDNPSFEIITAIFESAYEWDYLASPPRLVPLTAASPPEVTDDGRTWTIRLQRGIRFTDDPAFKSRARELTADDYVYSYKRWLDPNGRRGGSPILADLIVGARAVVDAARAGGKFDYDRPIEGLRALDRYTLRIRLLEPNYPYVRDLLGVVGAVAREVVEARDGDIKTHPVGTGPFRLREWKRGSRIVLDANPFYRRVRFPESGDDARADLVRAMRGKSLPQIGGVDVAIIDEDLTRMLEFLRGGLDYVVLRGEVANRLLAADGSVKREFASRGIRHYVFPEPFTFSFYFNMTDPVIGGVAPERVALRRAIAMAVDTEALVRVVYAGQAMPANQLVPPNVGGHDPTLPTRPLHDPAAAKTLLDRFGYTGRDANGYRHGPDGKPLALTVLLRSGAISREIQTLWKKNMDELGVRMDFHVTPFQDAIKELQQAQYQIYFGGFGGSPSGYPQLMQLYSRQSPQLNVTRFSNPDYDRAAEAFLRAATDAGQVAAARRMDELARNWMPELPAVFRLENDFVQPWVEGFSPPIFRPYWKYLDLDQALRSAAGR